VSIVDPTKKKPRSQRGNGSQYRKAFARLVSSSAGTFPAPAQKGTALGPKDYGYWVSEGGTHFKNMGGVETVSPTKPRAYGARAEARKQASRLDPTTGRPLMVARRRLAVHLNRQPGL
jgi:hypothetical protein